MDKYFSYWNTESYKCTTIHALCDFLKLKIHLTSKICRCEGHEKEYNSAASYYIKRRDSEVLWPMKNLLEWVCWIPSELLWRNLAFHSLFLSVLINTASVLIFLNTLHISHDLLFHFWILRYLKRTIHFLIIQFQQTSLPREPIRLLKAFKNLP